MPEEPQPQAAPEEQQQPQSTAIPGLADAYQQWSQERSAKVNQAITDTYALRSADPQNSTMERVKVQEVPSFFSPNAPRPAETITMARHRDENDEAFQQRAQREYSLKRKAVGHFQFRQGLDMASFGGLSKVYDLLGKESYYEEATRYGVTEEEMTNIGYGNMLAQFVMFPATPMAATFTGVRAGLRMGTLRFLGSKAGSKFLKGITKSAPSYFSRGKQAGEAAGQGAKAFYSPSQGVWEWAGKTFGKAAFYARGTSPKIVERANKALRAVGIDLRTAGNAKFIEVPKGLRQTAAGREAIEALRALKNAMGREIQVKFVSTLASQGPTVVGGMVAIGAAGHALTDRDPAKGAAEGLYHGAQFAGLQAMGSMIHPLVGTGLAVAGIFAMPSPFDGIVPTEQAPQALGGQPLAQGEDLPDAGPVGPVTPSLANVKITLPRIPMQNWVDPNARP